MTTLDRQGEALVYRLGGTWKHGGGMCRCPAHEDRTPSLSVRVGDSALLFKCFGGCTIAEILRALRRDSIDISGRPDSGHRAAAHSRQRSTAALRLWREAGPIEGTPAARYLASRRIYQTSHALRFHGSTPEVNHLGTKAGPADSGIWAAAADMPGATARVIRRRSARAGMSASFPPFSPPSSKATTL